MSKPLSYRGIPIEQMTKKELEQQKEENKHRIQARSAVFGIASMAAGTAMLPLALIPLGIGALTDYWLVKNNKKIEEELKKR